MINIVVDYWTAKTFWTDRSLTPQYILLDTIYHVYAIDNNFSVKTLIPIETPSSAELTDFLTNIEPTSNINLKHSVTIDTSNSASLSNVASSITLLANNTNRKQAIIHNDSSAILYVKFETTASTTSFTEKIAANTTFILPSPCYTGRIDGIWASATGDAKITEIT